MVLVPEARPDARAAHALYSTQLRLWRLAVWPKAALAAKCLVALL